MDEKLKNNKIRSAINLSHYLNIAEGELSNQKIFRKDPYRNFSNYIEIKEQIETVLHDNPKDKDILPSVGKGINTLENIEKLAAYEKGFLLSIGKKILKQGEFKKWVHNNFEFSYESAANYMKIYRKCINHPEYVFTFKKSVFIKILTSKLPDDLQKGLFELGRPDVTNQEIDDVLKSYNAGEIDENSPEIEDLMQFEDVLKGYERNKREEKDHMDTIKNIKEDARVLLESVDWPTLTDEGIDSLKRDLLDIFQLSDRMLDTYKNESQKPEFSLSEN